MDDVLLEVRKIREVIGDNYPSPLATIKNPHEESSNTLRGGGRAKRSEPERSDGERSFARPPPRPHARPRHEPYDAWAAFAFLAASAR